MARDPSKPVARIGLMSEREIRFCDEYLAHGDKVRAVFTSGLSEEKGLADTDLSLAERTLAKPAVHDYLLVMARGTGAGKLEDTIERLEAVRREAWRQGDYKQAGLADMQIADLKGWKIERQAILTQTVKGGDTDAMDTSALRALLAAASSNGALEKHGVTLGADGTLVRIENKHAVTDAVYSEVTGND